VDHILADPRVGAIEARPEALPERRQAMWRSFVPLRSLRANNLGASSVATATIPAAREHVVIVGGGFGGLAAALALCKTPVRVTLIDRRNYHLFQPLLYQVATAGLSPADIASPIRGILRRQRNTTVLLGKVTGIDIAGKAVLIGERRVGYDQLVIATGARHAYFNHDEWERFAPGLKKIDDATDIRGRILMAFEHAENTFDDLERRRLLTFIIVGGGPTGVEMAGAIAELARKALSTDFRNIDPRSARIILIESGPRVLAHFPETLSAAAKRALERLGVEVHVGTRVNRCGPDGVMSVNGCIEASTIIWAVGVMASPAGKWLEAKQDHAGRAWSEAILRSKIILRSSLLETPRSPKQRTVERCLAPPPLPNSRADM